MNGEQSVGNLIREARELAGTTLSLFAVMLKVSPATISHLERDGLGSNGLVVHALQLTARLLAEKYSVSYEERWTCEGCIEELKMVIVFCRVGDLEASIRTLPPSAGA
jgi:transcriptional regulator with XRE-family HTH domain